MFGNNNLTQAFEQWSSRPADERFWTLEDMQAATAIRRHESSEIEVPFDKIMVQDTGKKMEVMYRGDRAIPTNFAFGQICSTAGAPGSYLRKLPRDLAVQCINHGLDQRSQEGEQRPRTLLIQQNGGPAQIRSLTSNVYGRVWDTDLISDWLIPLRDDQGWRTPPARPAGHDPRARPATAEDLLTRSDDIGSGFGYDGLSVNLGDMIAPAGLYASDRDMFAFMIHENRVQAPSGKSLQRGFFLTQSEVGARSIRLSRYFFNQVCGNHIVWDAEGVQEVRVRHIGEGVERKAFKQAQKVLNLWADSQVSTQERVIAAAFDTHVVTDASARQDLIGATDEVVRDAVVGAAYGHLRQGIGREVLRNSYQAALDHPEDGHKGADTIWGMVQGMTRYSQEKANQDARESIDRAAGKLLQVAA
jgi:hypothetical protein